MVTIIVSSVVASEIITGIVVGGFIVCAIIAELTKVNAPRNLRVLNKSILVYSLPLSILVAYVVIIWVINTLLI